MGTVTRPDSSSARTGPATLALRRTVEHLSQLDTVKRVHGVMRVEGEAGA